jgi:hypothetical protein
MSQGLFVVEQPQGDVPCVGIFLKPVHNGFDLRFVALLELLAS